MAPLYQKLTSEFSLNLAFPVLEYGEMQIGVPQELPRGKAWLEGPYSLVRPQWLMMPGLGFDLKGARLGRGKGYYDRYLQKHSPLRVGIAWSEQIVEQVPVESHDCHMDFIITESFCWNVDQQKRF